MCVRWNVCVYIHVLKLFFAKGVFKAHSLIHAYSHTNQERLNSPNRKITKTTHTYTLQNVEKFAKRTVRVSKEMTQDAKTLIKLMGMPIIEAPTEAEAQCAVMCKAGLVHAVVSEDMDTLTFGAPVMIRNLFQPESRKIPVNEVTLSKVLEGLELEMPEFIDRE